MFKKPFRVTQQHKLKSSDHRKLLKDLKEQFPNVAEETWDTVLLPKKSDVTQLSIKFIATSGSAPDASHHATLVDSDIVIYCVDGLPMFFDTGKGNAEVKKGGAAGGGKGGGGGGGKKGKGGGKNAKGGKQGAASKDAAQTKSKKDMFPTVYAMWLCDSILPRAVETHSHVSVYILKGADLMLPGVRLQSLGLDQGQTWKKGDKTCVRITGNPRPIAVGTMACDTNHVLKMGLTGRAVNVLHCFGDHLWALAVNSGNRDSPDRVPEGFTMQKVYPTVVPASGKPEDEDESEDGGFEGGDGEDGDGEAATVQGETSQSSTTDSIVDQVEAVSLHGGEAENEEEVEEEEEQVDGDEDDGDQMTPQEMDALLEQCFLESIKNHIQNEDLPMEVGAIFNYMINCRPRDVKLDIKASSYKRLGKFIAAMKKRKIIQAKETKGNMYLVSINRSHPDYKKHALDYKPVQKASTSSSGGSGAKTTSAQQRSKNQIEVVHLYRAISPLAPLFPSDIDIRNALFTAKEVRDALADYANRNNLVSNRNKSRFVMDELLNRVLYSKNEFPPGSTIPREQLTERLLSKMTQFYALVKPSTGDHQPQPVIKKGKCTGVRLQRERIMGNKSVVKAFGLDQFDIDYSNDAFRSELQHKLSCSVKTKDPVMAQKADPDVLCQGNVISQLADHLHEAYGIPRSMIHIEDKVAGKKKKRR